MDEQRIVEEVIEACRALSARNLLAAADGNVSYRFADDRVLITPAGQSKARIGPADLAVMDVQNRTVVGEPSSERMVHTEIYRACPRARCVMHAHPPTAVAWTLARPNWTELPADVLPEVLYGVGSLPIVPYARPGTPELAASLRPFLPHCRVMILARHGAVSWGESVAEALNGMERLEHAAQILKLAHDLGGFTALDPAEAAALRALREKRGGDSR